MLSNNLPGVETSVAPLVDVGVILLLLFVVFPLLVLPLLPVVGFGVAEDVESSCCGGSILDKFV